MSVHTYVSVKDSMKSLLEIICRFSFQSNCYHQCASGIPAMKHLLPPIVHMLTHVYYSEVGKRFISFADLGSQRIIILYGYSLVRF